jgi:hypothetical protein
MTLQTVWMVGDWRNGDFGEAVAWLNAAARCRSFDNAAAALSGRRSNEAEDDPAAILLVESRSGMISKREVERLHAMAPLARLVALVGPWCEGEMRSGRPWTGVVRIPWRAWRARLVSALGLAHACDWEGPPPRTATGAEQIESSATKFRGSNRTGGAVAVRTSCRATFEALADALKQLGMSGVWDDDGESWLGARDRAHAVHSGARFS